MNVAISAADIALRTGRDDSIVGAIFCGSLGLRRARWWAKFRASKCCLLGVIDGLQRLTAVTLILEALARGLVDLGPVHGFST